MQPNLYNRCSVIIIYYSFITIITKDFKITTVIYSFFQHFLIGIYLLLLIINMLNLDENIIYISYCKILILSNCL